MTAADSALAVRDTAYSLDSFYADCRASLQRDAGPQGQERVRRHLLKLLRHPQPIRDALGPNPQPGRHALYRDPITGMHVFMHVHGSAGASRAHDHGPCWVVDGVLAGHVDMIDYVRSDDGSRPGHAELDRARDYRVAAGEAVLFQVGAIHETAHPDGGSILVRVVSGDMDAVRRHVFDPATGAVELRPPPPARA